MTVDVWFYSGGVNGYRDRSGSSSGSGMVMVAVATAAVVFVDWL